MFQCFHAESLLQGNLFKHVKPTLNKVEPKQLHSGTIWKNGSTLLNWSHFFLNKKTVPLTKVVPFAKTVPQWSRFPEFSKKG